MIIKYENAPKNFRIIVFYKPGKGRRFMQTKLQNLKKPKQLKMYLLNLKIDLRN